MKVYGVEIDLKIVPDILKYCGGAFTAQTFAKELEKLGVPQIEGVNYVSMAAASRIIQKLKADKKIKKIYGGGPNTLYKSTKRHAKFIK